MEIAHLHNSSFVFVTIVVHKNALNNDRFCCAIKLNSFHHPDEPWLVQRRLFIHCQMANKPLNESFALLFVFRLLQSRFLYQFFTVSMQNNSLQTNATLEKETSIFRTFTVKHMKCACNYCSSLKFIKARHHFRPDKTNVYCTHYLFYIFMILMGFSHSFLLIHVCSVLVFYQCFLFAVQNVCPIDNKTRQSILWWEKSHSIVYLCPPRIVINSVFHSFTVKHIAPSIFSDWWFRSHFNTHTFARISSIYLIIFLVVN